MTFELTSAAVIPVGQWLESLELYMLTRFAGRRTLDLALTSSLDYTVPPAIAGDAVTATLDDGSRAELRMPESEEDANLPLARCSRCSSTFGPCIHATVLAVDLASSAALREALREGADTREAAAGALATRRALERDRAFERGLRAWLAPAAGELAIEISATPFDAPKRTEGRAYGDRSDPQRGATLSIFVRPAGERKLLAPRELATLSNFQSRDRRVLQYVRDHGLARKVVQVRGVDASLTIEAMRAHGGIFAAGYKGLLDFRTPRVKPRIELGEANVLEAFWIREDDGAPLAPPDFQRSKRIPAEDAAFFSGPFPFVWTKTGAIFRVADGVDLDLAEEFVRAPKLVVPEGKMKDAGSRLHRAARGRGIELPATEAFGLPPVETPRLVLRLSGEPLAIEGVLMAVYRKREISLFSQDGLCEVDEGRDRESESRARDAVLRCGLVARDPEKDEEEGLDWRADGMLLARGEAAVTFWQHGLVALRASDRPPIEVELARRLAQVRVGSPIAGRVHIALEGDWLKTRLEFRTDDLPVELMTIQSALERKQRWVSLSDGTLARISATIETVADEAAEIMAGRAEASLPPHQLGRLDRWLEENDGQMDAAVEALRQRLRALAVAENPDLPSGLRATLRPYQLLGLSWLQFLQSLGAGGILADDMGLGKTITTLAFLLRRKEAEGPAPSLVVCPTSVATNWMSESERFTPDLRVRLLHGLSREERILSPEIIAETDIVITTYGLLRRDLDALAAVRFRGLVLDEAQNVKNADSATRKAAAGIDAAMRLALTGTPMENRLRDLWSIMSLVNPGILGSAPSFEKRFERPIVANRSSVMAAERESPVAAELRSIVRPFLLRRTKNDVLRELPPKTEIDRFVSLTTEDKRMYDALAHTLRLSLKRKIEIEKRPVAMTVFAGLVRLRQMACDPRLIDAQFSEKPSAKRETFLELVRELVSEGRRALVFSQFVQLFDLWRRDLDKEGILYEYLDGSTTKRGEVVARFQQGTAPLFLISLKAGGAGLNLTAADTVIHCDPWWNPAVEDQATDRAYRIGQDKPVTVVRLVARGTIEEKILALKAKKRDLTRAVIDDGASALSGLTEEDLRVLLGDEGA
ncbi:SNF2-related protein [Pendulispora albinea]|uniref:DEAD/DEAH box helicase n=1 Tax=Pendulispora albinea TaxID=2741071 RepID=A0ABZ2LY18_9BACT